MGSILNTSWKTTELPTSKAPIPQSLPRGHSKMATHYP